MRKLVKSDIVPRNKVNVLDFLDTLSVDQLHLLEDLVWVARCAKHTDEENEWLFGGSDGNVLL